MNPALRRRLERLAERHQEVGALLNQPDVAGDPARFRELSREYAQLQPLAETLLHSERNARELEHARAMLNDPDMRELAREEIAGLESAAEALDAELQRLLIPADPRDEANLYLEVRAGTGGDEAALFAGDLLRMYLRYAERQGWRTEILSEHEANTAGTRKRSPASRAAARIRG